MNNPTEILTASNIRYQERNHGQHLIVEGPKGFIDYWPSTGKWKDRVHNAPYMFGLQELIAHIKPQQTPSLDQAGEITQLKETLYNTQHELAILQNICKLYPGSWCCEGARLSNGWHHEESCKNWVLGTRRPNAHLPV